MLEDVRNETATNKISTNLQKIVQAGHNEIIFPAPTIDNSVLSNNTKRLLRFIQLDVNSARATIYNQQPYAYKIENLKIEEMDENWQKGARDSVNLFNIVDDTSTNTFVKLFDSPTPETEFRGYS